MFLVPMNAMGHLEDGGAVERMRRIVVARGLDPARATRDELEQCGAVLRCARCRTRDRHTCYRSVPKLLYDKARSTNLYS